VLGPEGVEALVPGRWHSGARGLAKERTVREVDGLRGKARILHATVLRSRATAEGGEARGSSPLWYHEEE
jgi:hypothetical protein